MATVTLTRDDLDPDITEDVKTVLVGYKGRTVEIDLGGANRERLEEFIAPFIAAGRAAKTKTVATREAAPRAGRGRKHTADVPATVVNQVTTPAEPASAPVEAVTQTATNGAVKLPTRPKLSRAEAAKENEAIRAWAGTVGIDLNPQGRIPNDVKARYYAETSTAGEVTEALPA